ncbi:MAG: hypothetical protein KAI47_28135 [Deltaproteobacteria bacterium]|nr:hypothetical protein [Deltaproteobacteria bacterium]
MLAFGIVLVGGLLFTALAAGCRFIADYPSAKVEVPHLDAEARRDAGPSHDLVWGIEAGVGFDGALDVGLDGGGHRDIDRDLRVPDNFLAPDRGPTSDQGPRPDRGPTLDQGSRPDRGFTLDQGPRPDRGPTSDQGPRPDAATDQVLTRDLPPACPRIGTFSDNFDDGTIDAAVWEAVSKGDCTVSETNGATVFKMGGKACHCELRTKNCYDLRGAGAAINVPKISNFHPAMVVFLRFEVTSTTYFDILFQGTSTSSPLMGARGFINGTQVVKETFGYTTALLWWRLREASGVLYFETSPDGNAWTSRVDFNGSWKGLLLNRVHVSFGVDVSGPMGKSITIHVPSYRSSL